MYGSHHLMSFHLLCTGLLLRTECPQHCGPMDAIGRPWVGHGTCGSTACLARLENIALPSQTLCAAWLIFVLGGLVL